MTRVLCIGFLRTIASDRYKPLTREVFTSKKSKITKSFPPTSN